MQMQPKYFPLDELFGFIEEPNRTACRRLFEDNKELFARARGSKTKHHAWEGGYVDHVVEACNIGLFLFDSLNSARPLPFSKSDVVLVLFLHDLEKPWKHAMKEGQWRDTPELGSKDKIKEFVMQKINDYGIKLTDSQLNALRYVEGENNDYDPVKRVMGELGALCHSADVLSARLWYNNPQKDPWEGARRNLGR